MSSTIDHKNGLKKQLKFDLFNTLFLTIVVTMDQMMAFAKKCYFFWYLSKTYKTSYIKMIANVEIHLLLKVLFFTFEYYYT